MKREKSDVDALEKMKPTWTTLLSMELLTIKKDPATTSTRNI
jgi:hypothetical protein